LALSARWEIFSLYTDDRNRSLNPVSVHAIPSMPPGKIFFIKQHISSLIGGVILSLHAAEKKGFFILSDYYLAFCEHNLSSHLVPYLYMRIWETFAR
jgi:hypothetical protein